MPSRTWTDDQLRDAVASNNTIAGVLRDIGLVPVGSNYATVYRYARRLRLPLDHMVGQRHGTSVSPSRRSLKELLVRASPYNGASSKLKQRLWREGVLKEECSGCGMGPEWRGLPLSLHIDHINGDRGDWRLHNLRTLCPNCHSQTTTYCGRNAGKGRRS